MNSPNINQSQLRDFQINFVNGQIRNEHIENIHELDEIIRIYGRNIISSITFYFHNGHHNNYYLILRNTGQNDKFVVEFYHYYNKYFQRVEITREEQQYDIFSVTNYLNSRQNLNTRLVQFIIDPFYIPQMMS